MCSLTAQELQLRNDAWRRAPMPYTLRDSQVSIRRRSTGAEVASLRVREGEERSRWGWHLTGYEFSTCCSCYARERPHICRSVVLPVLYLPVGRVLIASWGRHTTGLRRSQGGSERDERPDHSVPVKHVSGA